MEQSSSNKIIAGVILIIAVVLIAVAASMFGDHDSSSSGTGSTSGSSQRASTDKQTMSIENTGAVYRDGTYTVSDTYPSPGGTEDIEVVLTLKDNAVTSVAVTQDANERESAEYQGRFQESYKSKVVGKSINSLSLSRSSGASLTTNAFNDALEKIRQQAKA